jgi:hypothetical protein
MLRDPGEVGKTAQERRILKVLPRITSLSSVILERSAKQPKRGKPLVRRTRGILFCGRN